MVCVLCYLGHFGACLIAWPPSWGLRALLWRDLIAHAPGAGSELTDSPLCLPEARSGTPSSTGAISSSSWASSPFTRASFTTTASPRPSTSSALLGASGPCSEMAHGGEFTDGGRGVEVEGGCSWPSMVSKSTPGSAQRCTHKFNK